MAKVAEFLNKKYGEGTVVANIRDSYYNMKEKILPVMFVIDRAEKAMQEAGVKSITMPIRGGTDGATLSLKGLPCPNIFAGGLNFHGRYEFLPVPSLEKSMQTVLKIIDLAAKK